MLKFLVLDNGGLAADWPLRNAYLVGADNNAMRSDIFVEDGGLICEKREHSSAALCLQHDVGACGELTVQTTLLPERDEPYLLSLELARHRMMMLYTKMEEWQLFDLAAEHPAAKRTELAKKLFIETLCQQGTNLSQANKLADDCLIAAIDGSEELVLVNADRELKRRLEDEDLPKHPVGCGVAWEDNHEKACHALANTFDFLYLPTPWRALAPEAGDYRWDELDNWAEWAIRNRMPVIAGPLISFEPSGLPDWMYIWEHDYDTVRELVYEHIERVVTRYKNKISAWKIVSGLHVNAHFPCSFDQIIELTRLAAMGVKKVQPTGKVLVELRQPFGEYFGSNPRSIAPQMYADLVVQGNINFDAFGIQLMMGQPQSGQYTRDLLQISNLLDDYAGTGKPIHLTVAVPSQSLTATPKANDESSALLTNAGSCGYWRKPWTPQVQAHWLEAVFKIALSKPYIESVAWNQLADQVTADMPLSGLLTHDHQPKAALRRVTSFRRMIGASHKGQGTQADDVSNDDASNINDPGVSLMNGK